MGGGVFNGFIVSVGWYYNNIWRLWRGPTYGRCHVFSEAPWFHRLNTEKISRILLSPSFTTDLYSIRTLIYNLIKKATTCHHHRNDTEQPVLPSNMSYCNMPLVTFCEHDMLPFLPVNILCSSPYFTFLQNVETNANSRTSLKEKVSHIFNDWCYIFYHFRYIMLTNDFHSKRFTNWRSK